jgi:hypothetical protein
MRRSAGITISAVVALVGSGFILLLAGLVVLGLVLGALAPLPGKVSYFPAFAALFDWGFAAWGMATAVGLLKLREWARISLLVFAALLLFGAIVAGVAVLFVPMPIPRNEPNPPLTTHLIAMLRVSSAILYGGFGALGAWWLYYFNKHSVRDEFRRSSPVSPALLPFVGPMSHARPVSVSIIGAFMLIGVLSILVALVLRAPWLMFGFLFSGWTAVFVASPLLLAQFAAGVGLLRMKLWGRALAICILLFGLLNVIVTALSPGSQSRWDQAMQTIYARWGLPSTIAPLHFPVWLMTVPAVPIFFVELWFLITRKPAFLAAAKPSS